MPMRSLCIYIYAVVYFLLFVCYAVCGLMYLHNGSINLKLADCGTVLFEIMFVIFQQ